MSFGVNTLPALIIAPFAQLKPGPGLSQQDEANEVETWKGQILCSYADKAGHGSEPEWAGVLAKKLFDMAETVADTFKANQTFTAEATANHIWNGFLKNIMEGKTADLRYPKNKALVKLSPAQLHGAMQRFAEYLKGWGLSCTGEDRPGRYQDRLKAMKGQLDPSSVDEYVNNVERAVLAKLRAYVPAGSAGK